MLSCRLMLTTEKLMILLKYNWDVDRFARGTPARKRALLAGIDWGKYASLLHDLLLTSK